MKMIHLPFDIAGQMQMFVDNLNKTGHRAFSAVYRDSWLGYKSDLKIPVWWEENNFFLRNKKYVQFLYFIANNFLKYDVYHFYFGGSFFSDIPGFLGNLYPLDLKLLKKTRKKIIFHFFGCDIRDKIKLQNKYKYNPCSECKILCNQKKMKRNIKIALDYADRIILASPDLFDFIPESKAVFMPVAVNMENTLPIDKKEKKTEIFKIVHAPSNREIKGTKYIIEAVEKLKKENFEIELIMIEGIPNEQAQIVYKQADLAIDQLLIGCYGLFAVETMAFDIPTMCYIREDLVRFYPEDLPILKTTIDTLYEDLKNLIIGKERLDFRSREYVRKIHDADLITERLINIYKSC